MFTLLFRYIVLIFSWLTLFPLFFYLSTRWKIGLKPVRVILMLLSPLAVYFYLCLFIFGISVKGEIDRFFMYSDSEDISRITEVAFPKFSTKRYYPDESSFSGEFMNSRVVKFKQTPSDMFYHVLDSLCNQPNSYWKEKDGVYQYDRIWGNGSLAPSGEDENEDGFLSIELKKGEAIATISYGVW